MGSLPTAKRTAELMRLLITSQRHTNAQHLLDDVRLWGTTLQSAKHSGELYHLHHSSLHCIFSDLAWTASGGPLPAVTVLKYVTGKQVLVVAAFSALACCRAGHREHRATSAAHDPRRGAARVPAAGGRNLQSTCSGCAIHAPSRREREGKGPRPAEQDAAATGGFGRAHHQSAKPSGSAASRQPGRAPSSCELCLLLFTGL